MLAIPILLAALGCALGRHLGKALGRCPYAFSAQLSALFPGLLGLALGQGIGLTCLLAGGAACLGVYLSGHGSRLRAVVGALAGSGLGCTLGHVWLGGS